MTAVGLALGAACCWGIADFLAGLASRRIPVLHVLLLVEGGGLAAIFAYAIASGEPLPDGRTILLACAAGLAGVTALGCFYQALAIGTMSIVAPISATGVVLPVVVGAAGGDDLSAVTSAGLALAIAGVILASRETGHDAEAAALRGRSIVLALVAAAGFGTYFICVDPAVEESVTWTLVVGRAIAIPPVLALVVARSGDHARRPGGRMIAALCLIGCVDLLATVLLGIANNEGDVSVVSVLSAMYPVATALLAWIVLRERLARVQAAGVALALAGVAMVAAG